jgi:DNA-binding transcriptional ArsR family regulator
MKTDSELATLFASLAHPSRIAVFRCLLKHGRPGQSFGELAKAIEISPSTLTHHLREMEAAGILRREVAGRSTTLLLELDAMGAAIQQMWHLCCSEETTMDVSQEETAQ